MEKKILTTQARSKIMRAVKRQDTTPELALRKALYKKGFRYRIHDKSLPGTPDIVFRNRKLVVFVHGCYWHRHVGCRYASYPKDNADFWKLKFERNVERDNRTNATLTALGWRVIIVWECELRSKTVDETVDSLVDQIGISPSVL